MVFVYFWYRKYRYMVNCIHINELDVRLLNFSIRTYVDQVMVLLPSTGQVGQVRSARLGLTTCDLQLWVFLESIERPLSQDFIHMPLEDIRCQAELSQVRSARPS